HVWDVHAVKDLIFTETGRNSAHLLRSLYSLAPSRSSSRQLDLELDSRIRVVESSEIHKLL
ncbi:unnamed protein product, partial [Allacma fusca]